MRAATEFQRVDRPAGAFRIAAHGHDAHFIAVFFAKQRHGALGNRRIYRHQPRVDRIILQDNVICHGLDLAELIKVKVLETDEKGRVKLSLKALLDRPDQRGDTGSHG